MNSHSCIPNHTLKEIGKVIVLEAPDGQARRDCLQQWLQQAQQSGALTWLVQSDCHLDGPWGGLRNWLIDLLPQIQTQAPDLIANHDYELTRVLPELRRSLTVRYASLTDIAPQQEQIRNYPADRAFRILHGIIDLLSEWFERSGSTRWVIACDRYDCSGSLVRLFFTELIRRRGQQLNLTLLIAIEAGADEAIVGKFNSQFIGTSLKLPLPANSSHRIDQQHFKYLAQALEQQIADDPIEQELYLPRLIHYLLLSQQSELALKYQIQASALYSRKGFYEDGLAYALAALAQLEHRYPQDCNKRWSLSSILYTCYVALDKPTQAFDVLKVAMQQTSNPNDRFRGCFMMAMLYIRELAERDLIKAEAYLEQGLLELEKTDLSEDMKLFHQTVNRNGLALIRYRQGRHQDAVELCQWCYEQVDAVLKPEQHKLYRSVLLFNIAQVYDFVGECAKALEYYSVAMNLDPNYSEYYNSRGNLYFKMGDINHATQDYLKAIESSAPYCEVWANLGQCYRQLGELERAINAYSAALDLQPNQASVLVARAQTLEAGRQMESALADYTAALTIDPGQSLVLANRAALYYDTGYFSEAIHDLSQAIALSPDIAELYGNRAIAWMALGDTYRATQDFKVCLHLNPAADDYRDLQQQISSNNVPLL